MGEAVIAEARERGEATVTDTREPARAVEAQLDGQVMCTKLYNSAPPAEPLWDNCRALLGATVV